MVLEKWRKKVCVNCPKTTVVSLQLPEKCMIQVSPNFGGLTWPISHGLDALDKLSHPCLWVLEYPAYPVKAETG